MIKRLLLVLVLTLLFPLTFSTSSSGQGDDLATAESLNQQVIKLYRQGRYADAIPLAKKVLAIFEKALGHDPEQPGGASCGAG
jgi:hypothetical protein